MQLSLQQQLGLGLAGAAAGCGSRTLTAPLERLKVLLQAGLVADHPWIALPRLARDQGWRSLFRGNFANCLKVGPSKAIKFLGYENLRHRVCTNPLRPTSAEDLCCSSCIAGVSCLVTFPLDTIKTRLSISEQPMRISATYVAATRSGVSQIYKGASPALMSTVPFVGISMTTFMQGKHIFREKVLHEPQGTPLPPSAIVLISSMANVMAQLLTYPLYCIKTNMQIADAADRESILQCAQRLVRARGVRSLYAGVGVATLKAMPSLCISFLIYEEAKEALGLPS